ncbi:hypothetical protein SL055_000632 [Flavobacterium psychrophilum]|jgi:hypothetical protein|nr:hypothetical protein [Flavobacterium psychrophilum]
MKILHTIQEPHKMFDTAGSSPLLVTCNDFNDWVCKYDRFPKYLFNELIAAEFAKLWTINVPETALINVKDEHILYDKYPSLQPSFFEKECFGSLFMKNTKEIDLSFIPSFREKSFRDRIQQKSDFLKIALFDIWLCNEDRNYNNTNLLLHFAPENIYFFYAIDHVNIFNSSSLNYGLATLTEDDTLLKTELAKLLFGKAKKLTLIVDKLIENFYLCTKECEDNLDVILDLLPVSWAIDKVDMKAKMLQYLFTNEWKKQCEDIFRTYVQSFIKN